VTRHEGDPELVRDARALALSFVALILTILTVALWCAALPIPAV